MRKDKIKDKIVRVHCLELWQAGKMISRYILIACSPHNRYIDIWIRLYIISMNYILLVYIV